MNMPIPSFDDNYLPRGYVRITEGEYAGLLCLQGYLKLSDEEKKKICNGIGAAGGITRHFPSTIWGLDCSEAGNIHDYSYDVGGDKEDRYVGDCVFLFNLRRIIKDKGCWLLRCPRYSRANKYYIALRIGGGAHFKWHDMQSAD